MRMKSRVGPLKLSGSATAAAQLLEISSDFSVCRLSEALKSLEPVVNSVVNMCRKSAKTIETISCCQFDHGSSDFRSLAGLVCTDSGRWGAKSTTTYCKCFIAALAAVSTLLPTAMSFSYKLQ